MAIYHLSFKTAAKGQGRSAKAHAQYIEREGKYALSRVNEELEYKASGNMPAWAEGKELDFWNASDLNERANGRVYSEFEIALPREFSKEQRQELVNEFIGQELKGQPYTVAIHNKRALDGGEQPHAHIMFSERQLDGIERSPEQFFKRANDKSPEKGGTKKNRDWNRREKIDEVRLSWETTVNKALERYGIPQRVDRRTLKEQGIDRTPEPKMGPERTQMMKAGKSTEISDQVIELRHYRTEEREVKKLEEQLKQEKARVYDFGERTPEERQGQPFSIERKGEAREVSEAEKQRYQRVLDLVFTKTETQQGHTEYSWERSGRVAFVDEGDRITFNNSNQTAIKAGLQLAKQKGWTETQATGSEEFRREAWVQGQVLGLKVTGYEHTKADELEVERRQNELEKKKAQDKEQDKAKEKGRNLSGSDTGDRAQKTDTIKASDAIKACRERVKDDLVAYQNVTRELSELPPSRDPVTEVSARRMAENEFSNGQSDVLDAEIKAALIAREKAQNRQQEFAKEKGFKSWLPQNLKEGRKLQKDSEAADATYNGKVEAGDALKRKMDEPKNKRQIDRRAAEILKADKAQQERRKDLEKQKTALNRKLTPYRDAIEKLKKLGDREIKGPLNERGERRIDMQSIENELRKLEQEQDKKRAKGRGLGL